MRNRSFSLATHLLPTPRKNTEFKTESLWTMGWLVQLRTWIRTLLKRAEHWEHGQPSPPCSARNTGSQSSPFMQETGRVLSRESCQQKKENLRILTWRVPQQKAHPHHRIVFLRLNKPHLYIPSCQPHFLSLYKYLPPRNTWHLRKTSTMHNRYQINKKKKQPGENWLAERWDINNPRTTTGYYVLKMNIQRTKMSFGN